MVIRLLCPISRVMKADWSARCRARAAKLAESASSAGNYGVKWWPRRARPGTREHMFAPAFHRRYPGNRFARG
ncbi:hypothetical protein Acsp05_02640 [Actinokineospora sp. NBRC 105648]|nr:hypothetical protein Acsp05_02640 [Actinokineospora sp. NBRC 105648]